MAFPADTPQLAAATMAATAVTTAATAVTTAATAATVVTMATAGAAVTGVGAVATAGAGGACRRPGCSWPRCPSITPLTGGTVCRTTTRMTTTTCGATPPTAMSR